jgi:hypothetical protein
MNQTFIFLSLGIAMFFGSFISGCLPIWIATTPQSAGNISLFGAGLLIGVSLIIIIPEGIRAMFLHSFSDMKYNGPGMAL